MYIKRQQEEALKDAAKKWPVVTVLGTRQAGKTTLVRNTFPDYPYANLEDPIVRHMAISDPKSFFEKYPAPAIIDEIQNVPALLSHIQVLTDESGLLGQYILTGSHQPLLKARVSQSLAGRTAIITVHPFSLAELGDEYASQPLENLLFRGFLPRLYANPNLEAHKVYEEYYGTYVSRDLCQMAMIPLKDQFEIFIRLLAGRVGQLVNYESLSNDVGVSATTIRQWISILEASYIIYPVRPYFNNFGKRFIKSPKLYFTEVGLAIHLLNISAPEQLLEHPLYGSIFENFILSEAMKWQSYKEKYGGWYFLRTSNGTEADLVWDEAGKLHLMEIKSSRTPNQDLAKNLRSLEKLVPCLSKTIIYKGENFPISGGGEFVNYQNLFSRLDKLNL